MGRLSLRSKAVFPILVALTFAVLLFRQSMVPKPGFAPMRPAPDLLRLTFPTAGVTVAEHGSKHLEIVTDRWILSANAIASTQAETIMSVMQKSIARLPDGQEDMLNPHGVPTLYRFLVDVQGPHQATRADYVIDFGGGWVIANAYSRIPTEVFDVSPVDRILLASRLGEQPRPEREVLPAWRSYQARRKPGSPIAKFVVAMDPAPVRLGNFRTRLEESSVFRDSDFKRGGRQVTPDLVEFYTRDDPTSIRVDVWFDSPPAVEGREAIFDARLHVEPASLGLWSMGEPCEVPAPAGEYDVAITLVHRGKTSEPTLTDEEYFARDDLERYEILLKRRPLE